MSFGVCQAIVTENGVRASNRYRICQGKGPVGALQQARHACCDFKCGASSCRHASGAPLQGLEGAASPPCVASPSSAHDSPVRHGTATTIRSPVRRPARNVLFPSPQNVSTLHDNPSCAWVQVTACVMQPTRPMCSSVSGYCVVHN